MPRAKALHDDRAGFRSTRVSTRRRTNGLDAIDMKISYHAGAAESRETPDDTSVRHVQQLPLLDAELKVDRRQALVQLPER